jgi:hypothetical protein
VLKAIHLMDFLCFAGQRFRWSTEASAQKGIAGFFVVIHFAGFFVVVLRLIFVFCMLHGGNVELSAPAGRKRSLSWRNF